MQLINLIIIFIVSLKCVDKNKIYKKIKQKIINHNSGINQIKKCKKSKSKKLFDNLNLFKEEILEKDYNLTTIIKNLSFKNLPQSFDKYRIILFSDAHILFLNEKILKKLVNKINNLNPDIVLFTGDLVKSTYLEATPSKIEILKKIGKLKSKHTQIISIFGNHDYGIYDKKNKSCGFLVKEKLREAKQNMINLHKKLGWILLANQYIDVYKGNEKIEIIGIEHLAFCGTLKNEGDINVALKNNYQFSHFSNKISKTNTQTNTFKIMMAHDPDVWPFILGRYQFPLTVSGHTHGSRITFDFDEHPNIQNLSWRIPFDKNLENKTSIDPNPGFCVHKYYSGLYCKNNCYLYVNNGCSFSSLDKCKIQHGKKICKDNIYYNRDSIPLEVTLLILEKSEL